jgi:hypothetical protein
MAPDSLLHARATRECPSAALHDATVEIVIPVRNEERDLGPSVRHLHAYLRDQFPFTARITIADNGSDDGTWAVATALAQELGSVRAVRTSGQAGAARCARSGWPAMPTSTRTWTSTCRPT